MPLNYLKFGITISILVFIVFIYFFLYWLNFSGFIFPNDGVYYIAIASHLLEFSELKDPIYDPPRKLLTPQLSQIFLIAGLKLIGGQMWIFIYGLIQIVLFLLAFVFLKNYFFSGPKKNYQLIIFFLLILILPIFTRNFTNFHSEGIYFPLFLIFVSLSWKIIFEKSSLKLCTIIFFLGTYLVFFRVQFLVEIIPLSIMAIYFGFKRNIYYLISLTLITLSSFLIYSFFIYDLILSDVQTQVFVQLKHVPYEFFIEVLNFFSFPFLYGKYIAEYDWIVLKFFVALFFIFSIGYFQKSFKVMNHEHFLFFSLSILINIIFLSFIEFFSQRYYLIPYTFIAFFISSLIVQKNNRIPKYFFSIILIFTIISSSYFTFKNFTKLNEIKSLNYLNATKFLEEKQIFEDIACDEPRMYFWFTNSACKHYFSYTGFKSDVYQSFVPSEVVLIGTESYTAGYAKVLGYKIDEKLYESGNVIVSKIVKEK